MLALTAAAVVVVVVWIFKLLVKAQMKSWMAFGFQTIFICVFLIVVGFYASDLNICANRLTLNR